MKTSTLVIAVAVLLGVLIAVGIAASGSSDKDSTNILYNYEIKSTTDSIPYGSGSFIYYDKAQPGYTYQPMKFTIRNTGYDKGYDVNMTALAIKCSDGNQYSYKYSSSYYYGDMPQSGLKLGVGSQTSYTMVFEIPKSVSVTEVVWTTGTYSGIHASYDPDLA